MRQYRWITLTILLGLFLTLCGWFSYDAVAADKKDADVAVIVNSSVKDKSISKKDLSKVYLGKKTSWSDKSSIVFVCLNKGDVHDGFMKDYVGKSSSQFTNYWKKQVFSGKGKMPQEFKTEKDMLDFVAKTKGAIGYVSTKAATDAKATTISVTK